MKILITTDWYKPAINGVVTSVANLEQELRRRGHEVKIITLSQDFTARKEGNVYYLKSVDVGRLYPYARASCFLDKRYFDELLAWKPDIIHSQCEFSTFYAAKRVANELNVPIVHTYHTVYEDYTHYFAPTRAWSKKLVACFSKQITNHVQSVIVPTEKVRKLLLGYGTHTEINVIPTGIETGKYQKRYSPEEIQVLKIQLGIPLTDHVLVAVGRLAKEKNVEELIGFFSRLWRENDGCEGTEGRGMSLVIVGDGPYRREVEACAAASPARGKIYFTGMVSPVEAPLYYQLGDLFLCASNSETQGMTYIEAMASGLPVVCRRDPCVDGVVQNGVNGYQYETYDGFLQAVENTLESIPRRARMAAAAARTAADYSVETFADKVENLYFRKVLQAGPESAAAIDFCIQPR